MFSYKKCPICEDEFHAWDHESLCDNCDETVKQLKYIFQCDFSEMHKDDDFQMLGENRNDGIALRTIRENEMRRAFPC